jgi:hypothetical protein
MVELIYDFILLTALFYLSMDDTLSILYRIMNLIDALHLCGEDLIANFLFMPIG